MSTQFTNRQWRLPNNENKAKQSNYSMDFDGVNDYIDCGSFSDYDNGDLSVSMWIKKSTMGTYEYALSNSGSSAKAGFDIVFENSFRRVSIGRRTRTSDVSTGFADIGFTLNTWHNIAFTYQDSTRTLKVYMDSVLQSTTIGSASTNSASLNLTIGSYQGTSNFASGKIDAVSIFNYELSSSQVTTLYGSSSTGIGNPMSLNPVAFYQLGDKSAFNGANYLVPNIAAEEADGDIATSYSPYALDFDAASGDYIDCGQNTNLDTGDLSVSIWINKDSTGSGTQYIFNNNNGSSIAGFAILMNSINRVFLYRNTGTYSANTGYTNVGFTTDTWHHLCFTYNDTTKSFVAYFNGVSFHTSTATSSSGGTSQNIIIGTNSGLSGSNFDGLLSNASIWNTALTSSQVTELYNEGVPSNLNNHSAYSNLVSWWQLGSNSSFNTNWTVLDEKGSNNGTSVNMTEDDIVDGVGSYANGVGTSGLEVVGSAPFSDANSLSVNMDVEDRVTDTPS